MDREERLRKNWGNKPCNHSEIQREKHDLGGATGDYVCVQCGKVFMEGEEWERKKSNEGRADHPGS